MVLDRPLITLEELAPGRWRVALVGEHDLSTADELARHIATLLLSGANESVIVDLSAASFVDSSIVGAIVRHGQDPRLALVVPPGSTPERIVRLLGVHTMLPVHADMHAARPAPAANRGLGEAPGRVAQAAQEILPLGLQCAEGSLQ